MPRHQSFTECLKIGVDTGGTFTDLVVIQGQTIRHHKVRSTPHNPAEAVVRGLRELVGRTPIDQLIHGSTVATNALLERKGAQVAFITTNGFQDLIAIGRQNRQELYSFIGATKPTLLKRQNQFTVDERISYQGRVLKALTANKVKALLQELKQNKRVDAYAICLLSAYANSRHEKILQRALNQLGKPISISSEILPEYREYERAVATLLNAYLSPVMRDYLDSLDKSVNSRQLHIMQSNGGVISAARAQEEAIRTLLSGPAGGVAGAAAVAQQLGLGKIISFDMGGTSTDLCLIDGAVPTTSTNSVDGIPVSLPMIPIHTIGAGGGSIAWVDPGGALQVGPHSAGAYPGPACYGRGEQMTITDAHLYLNRLHGQGLLGGTMPLNKDKARAPLRKLAATLKVSMRSCAEGILAIANAHMENAIRVISTQKGYDPREFTLVSFGGCGSLHACEIAKSLGIPQVLVPNNPGTLSAFGMAISPWRRDYSQTVLLKTAKNLTAKHIQKRFQQLYKKAHADIRREGEVPKDLSFAESVDVRFQGQAYEINVPFSTGFIRSFKQKHQQHYGFIHKSQAIEVVTLRLTARGRQQLFQPDFPMRLKKSIARPFDQRSLKYDKRDYTIRYYERDELPPGTRLKGPVVVCEYSATTFVPPGFKLRVDPGGNLWISMS